MRTMCSLLCVLFVSGMVWAADTTSAKSPAPAVAPAAEKAAPAPAPAAVEAPAPTPAVEAPAPAPAPAPVEVAKKPCAAPGSPLLTWGGLAMLRLRDEIITNYRNDGKKLENGNFSYQIAYKLGVKAKPNDQVMLQFEIGNDWYATEEVEGLPGNYWTKRNPMTPWFDLACVQWDPGFMHVQAGIIPVRGTPLMDLLGVSIFLNRNYQKAAHIPWGVVTNFSQTGLRLGAPIVKGDFSLGVDAMSTVIEMRKVPTKADSFNLNPIAVEFELEVPLSVAGFTATPQAYIIPNRTYNLKSGKSDLEFGAGFDVGYKINPDITLRAGFGYARTSNRNTYLNSDGSFNTFYDTYGDPFNITSVTDTVNKVTDNVEFDRWATNMNIGTTAKLGPGKLDFDFNLSNQQNAYPAIIKAANGTTASVKIDDWYPFFDLKYGWAINKNFIIMPRIRLFFTEPKDLVVFEGNIAKFNNMLTSRPEIIFTGTF